MNIKIFKILILFFIGSVFTLVPFSKVLAADWYSCVAGNEYDVFTCFKDTGDKNLDSFNCVKNFKYDSFDKCKLAITSGGLKYMEPVEALKKIEEQANQALLEAQKQAQIKKDKESAQAIIDNKKNAIGMYCDCSKKSGGTCKDDFSSPIEASDYCQKECGILNPSISSDGCPLGTKEIGIFACTCDKVCDIYNFYSEAKKKCSSTGCSIKNDGSCLTGLSDVEIKLLKEKAKDLNPAGFLTGKAGIIQLIGKAISFLLYPIGAFTMALYVWAGFLWMTSSGKSESVEKSKTIIIWTTFGLIATLASFMIVKFVFTQILNI